MDGGMGGWMDGGRDKWMNGWVYKWLNKRTSLSSVAIWYKKNPHWHGSSMVLRVCLWPLHGSTWPQSQLRACFFTNAMVALVCYQALRAGRQETCILILASPPTYVSSGTLRTCFPICKSESSTTVISNLCRDWSMWRSTGKTRSSGGGHERRHRRAHQRLGMVRARSPGDRGSAMWPWLREREEPRESLKNLAHMLWCWTL